MKSVSKITQCLFFEKKAKYRTLVFIFEIGFYRMIEIGSFVDCKADIRTGSCFLFVGSFLLKCFVLFLVVLCILCCLVHINCRNAILMPCIFCKALDLCFRNLHFAVNLLLLAFCFFLFRDFLLRYQGLIFLLLIVWFENWVSLSIDMLANLLYF